VLLDDLGSEGAKVDTVVEIIMRRHDRSAPTWATTFLSMSQLADRYGAGATRRLVERATIIHCGASR
jgi:DNA replication protein DnaC